MQQCENRSVRTEKHANIDNRRGAVQMYSNMAEHTRIDVYMNTGQEVKGQVVKWGEQWHFVN